MDGGEPIRRRAAVVLQPPDDFGPHIPRVQPFGVVAGRSGGVGLGIEPVLIPRRIKVRGLVRELVERG